VKLELEEVELELELDEVELDEVELDEVGEKNNLPFTLRRTNKLTFCRRLLMLELLEVLVP
jgi:hypothetical protein